MATNSQYESAIQDLECLEQQGFAVVRPQGQCNPKRRLRTKTAIRSSLVCGGSPNLAAEAEECEAAEADPGGLQGQGVRAAVDEADLGELQGQAAQLRASATAAEGCETAGYGVPLTARIARLRERVRARAIADEAATATAGIRDSSQADFHDG